MSQNRKKFLPGATGPRLRLAFAGAPRRQQPWWLGLIRPAAESAFADALPRIEIDAPVAGDCPLDPALLRALVRSLVRAATEDVSDCREVLITICATDESFEIEVADDGPPLQQRAPRLPLAAAAAGAELRWEDCPQGGVAVTAMIRRTGSRRLAA